MDEMSSSGRRVLPLARLHPGQSGAIAAVHAEEALHRRLQALGFRVGRRVEVIRRARFGGPLHVRLGTTELMLRRHDAENIDVFVSPGVGPE